MSTPQCSSTGNNNNGHPPKWTLQRIAELCNAPRFFKTQAQLFEYIEQENERRLQRAAVLGANTHSNNSTTSSTGVNYHSASRGVAVAPPKIRTIGLTDSGDLDLSQFNNFLCSATSSGSNSSSLMTASNANNNNNNNNNFSSSTFGRRSSIGGGAGGTQFSAFSGETELLRPFCIQLDPSAAPQPSLILSSQTNTAALALSLSNIQQQQQRPMMSIAAGLELTQEQRKQRESNLFSMFNEAGKTSRESLQLPQRRAERTTTPTQDEDERRKTQQQQPIHDNNAVETTPTAKRSDSPGGGPQQQQVQTRFFLPMTLSDFVRVAQGDVLPFSEQHFYEIIQDGAPCVLYFDVEMELPHALTEQEHALLKEQMFSITEQDSQRMLEDSQQNQLGTQEPKKDNGSDHDGDEDGNRGDGDDDDDDNLDSASELSRSLSASCLSQSKKSSKPWYFLTKEKRVKHKCCPVDCDVTEFDPTLARDVMIEELKHFANEVLCLPLQQDNNNNNNNNVRISPAQTPMSSQASELFDVFHQQKPRNSNSIRGPTTHAIVDDGCFFVLISNSANSAAKFSQHYIVRFKDHAVRFANNLDVKVFVTSFVQYLYGRAVESKRVHQALFFHESTSRRKCAVQVKRANGNTSSHNVYNIKTERDVSPQRRLSETSFSFLGGGGDSCVSDGGGLSGASTMMDSLGMLSNTNINNNNNNNNRDDDSLSRSNSQQSVGGSFIECDFSLPAISLRCIIDEAVYTKNRMMRCCGSCKLGKSAVLQFDEEWHSENNLDGGHLTLDRYTNGFPGGMLGATLISEPLCCAARVVRQQQQQPQQQQQQLDQTGSVASVTQLQTQRQLLGTMPTQTQAAVAAKVIKSKFKLIDSDVLTQHCIACGNHALALRAPGSAAAASVGNGGMGSSVPQTRAIIVGGANSSSGGGGGASFGTTHDSTAMNGAAVLMKLPLLAREIVAAQAKLDRSAVAAGTAASMAIESMQVHVPKGLNEWINSGGPNGRSLSPTSGGHHGGRRDSESPSRFDREGNRTVTITAKIRGSRFCHVVGRQHRSNGVFWIVKFFPFSSSMIMEQRCFDEECRSKQQFRHSVTPSDAAVTEMKMYLRIGLVAAWSAQENDPDAAGTMTKTQIDENNARAIASCRAYRAQQQQQQSPQALNTNNNNNIVAVKKTVNQMNPAEQKALYSSMRTRFNPVVNRAAKKEN